MEAEMELTLEELRRIEAKVNSCRQGKCYVICEADWDRLTDAARAHLEGQDPDLIAVMAFPPLPQPPQQREDGLICLTCGMKARPGSNYCPECFFSLGEKVTCECQPPQQREDDGIGLSTSSFDSGDTRFDNPELDRELELLRKLEAVVIERDRLRAEIASSPAPSSTQQREDDGTWTQEEIDRAWERGRRLSKELKFEDVPAPSSTVDRELRMQGVPVFAEPSPDAGLVERLRDQIEQKIDTQKMEALMEEAAAALEAKDAEILEQARLNGMGAERELALRATIEAQAREIERLRAKVEDLGPEPWSP
jgi:polyhydroxyalkanoate synthesis regulator phasin